MDHLKRKRMQSFIDKTNETRKNRADFTRLVLESSSSRRNSISSSIPEASTTAQVVTTSQPSTSQTNTSIPYLSDDDEYLSYYSSEESDSDDVTPIDSNDQTTFEGKQIEMTSSERIMLLLLHQARFNSTNREIEYMAQMFNSMTIDKNNRVLFNCTNSPTSQLTQNIPITDVSELCTYTTINNVNYLFSIFNKHM